jgi:hypothetical protein
MLGLWRACNLTAFTQCLTGPVAYPFASRHEGPGFNPQGGTCVSCVSLHWWPRCDWSLWPHLRRASSQTVVRPSSWQCDNPTWSHTALLSRFHTRCRSSFRLHNRHNWLLWGSPVDSLQSHCIRTMSHWSSGLPICFPSWGTQVQSQGGGVLVWNWDSPISIVSLQGLQCIILYEPNLSLGQPFLITAFYNS